MKPVQVSNQRPKGVPFSSIFSKQEVQSFPSLVNTEKLDMEFSSDGRWPAVFILNLISITCSVLFNSHPEEPLNSHWQVCLSPYTNKIQLYKYFSQHDKVLTCANLYTRMW